MGYAVRKDGQGWRAVDGKYDCNSDEIFSESQPLPKESTVQELMIQAVGLVRDALQLSIDDKAKSLGFSSGNALMLYAGFINPFQSLAHIFASWEASVWVEAEAYKTQVIAGGKSMLSPKEAVAMMPVYPY